MARIRSPVTLIRRCLARNIIERIDGGIVTPVATTQFPVVPFMGDTPRNAGAPFHSGVLQRPLLTCNSSSWAVAAAIVSTNRRRGLSSSVRPSDASPESDGTLEWGGHDLDDAKLMKLFSAAADSSNGHSELALQAILRIYEDRVQKDRPRAEFFHVLADELGVKRKQDSRYPSSSSFP